MCLTKTSGFSFESLDPAGMCFLYKVMKFSYIIWYCSRESIWGIQIPFFCKEFNRDVLQLYALGFNCTCSGTVDVRMVSELSLGRCLHWKLQISFFIYLSLGMSSLLSSCNMLSSSFVSLGKVVIKCKLYWIMLSWDG